MKRKQRAQQRQQRQQHQQRQQRQQRQPNPSWIPDPNRERAAVLAVEGVRMGLAQAGMLDACRFEKVEPDGPDHMTVHVAFRIAVWRRPQDVEN